MCAALPLHIFLTTVMYRDDLHLHTLHNKDHGLLQPELEPCTVWLHFCWSAGPGRTSHRPEHRFLGRSLTELLRKSSTYTYSVFWRPTNCNHKSFHYSSTTSLLIAILSHFPSFTQLRKPDPNDFQVLIFSLSYLWQQVN